MGAKMKMALAGGLAVLLVNTLCSLVPAFEPGREELTAAVVALILGLIGGHAHTDAKVTSAMITAGKMVPVVGGRMTPADGERGQAAIDVLLAVVALGLFLALGTASCATARPGALELRPVADGPVSGDRCYVLTFDDAPVPVMSCVAHPPAPPVASN